MKIIKFQIKGLGKVSSLLLEDFISELENIKKVLDSLNKDLHPEKAPQLSYEIVKIRKNSPTYVELLPTLQDKSTNGLVDCFYSGLKAIPKGKVPDKFSINTVQAYSQIGKSTIRNEIIFFENGRKDKIKIKNSFEKYVNEIYKQTYYTEQGSISGKLDTMNLHGTKKTITIYPNYAPAINCLVNDNLLHIVEKAVLKKVTVSGKIKTKINEKYPFEIIVDSIRIHKPKNEIPNVEELWGMMSSQNNIN
ncbi:MAG: hypothetical protein B6D44_16095 [Ignavibacteriales bacterium UTCHB2]|nr:MAG: hypothetical protein B6D44_16095 [Ignavibacteriales bacterium UTCHB2]